MSHFTFKENTRNESHCDSTTETLVPEMLIGTEFDHRSEMRQVFFPFQFGKVLSLIFGVYGKRIDGY